MYHAKASLMHPFLCVLFAISFSKDELTSHMNIINLKATVSMQNFPHFTLANKLTI